MRDKSDHKKLELECNINTIYRFYRFREHRAEFDGLTLYKSSYTSHRYVVCINGVEILTNNEFNYNVSPECKEKIIKCIESEASRIRTLQNQLAEREEQRQQSIIKKWCNKWKI